jgi:hypothetical protein
LFELSPISHLAGLNELLPAMLLELELHLQEVVLCLFVCLFCLLAMELRSSVRGTSRSDETHYLTEWGINSGKHRLNRRGIKDKHAETRKE